MFQPIKSISKCLRVVKDFARDQRGAFPVMFAMLSVPLVGMGWMAADHLATATAHQRFDTAADAGALAAINTARRLAQGDTSCAASGRGAAQGGGNIIYEARLAGLRAFRAQIRDQGAARINHVQVHVVRTGNEYTARGEWTGEATSHFGSLFRIASYPLSGEAVAQTAIAQYTNIHVVMDFSASMLIGVSQADHDAAVALTRKINRGMTCAFLCHLPLNQNRPTYPAGKGIVRLRIDVMRDAVLSALDDLERNQIMPNQFGIGVYGFSNEIREFLPATDPRARRFDDVRAVVRATDPWPSSGGGTAFYHLFPHLDRVIPESLDGTTPSRPRQVMILVTDGVEDRIRYRPGQTWSFLESRPVFSPSVGWMGMQNLNPAFCNALKSKGVDIIVVRVRYVVPPIHAGWNEFRVIRNTLEPLMPNTLGACATSSSHYVVADTPDEIQRGIQAAFRLAAPIRLTH